MNVNKAWRQIKRDILAAKAASNFQSHARSFGQSQRTFELTSKHDIMVSTRLVFWPSGLDVEGDFNHSVCRQIQGNKLGFDILPERTAKVRRKGVDKSVNLFCLSLTKANFIFIIPVFPDTKSN